MVWQKYVFIVVMLLSMTAAVSAIGQKRKPMTSGVAAGSCLLGALLIWLVLSI